MTRLLKWAGIGLLALMTCVPVASARGFGGGFRGGFGGYGGGFYAGTGFYGFYPGFAYGPWYGPWYGPGYYPMSNIGKVEIVTKHKGDQIFVDGGFAGLTGDLKTFPLRAGSHTIELRNSQGQTYYQERVNVIAGKKLKIQSDYAG